MTNGHTRRKNNTRKPNNTPARTRKQLLKLQAGAPVKMRNTRKTSHTRQDPAQHAPTYLLTNQTLSIVIKMVILEKKNHIRVQLVTTLQRNDYPTIVHAGAGGRPGGTPMVTKSQRNDLP